MADTIRETIIKAFLTRLAAWKTTGGFVHNCGNSVFRAVPHIDQASLPACVLFPQAETVEKQYGKNICTMTLKLEALAAIGEDDDISVIQEQLLGDAIKVMTVQGVTITSLINSISYTGGGPQGTNKQEQTSTGISTEFVVKYQTTAGNPYSQA